jgi:hypothetical protein
VVRDRADPPRESANTATQQPVFPLAGTLDDFQDLLPTLLSPGLGDAHGATQVAGSWLRRLGADALVFPSARADTRVSIASGELHEWYGWNLVDYRDSPSAIGQFVILSRWHQFPSASEDPDRGLPDDFRRAELLVDKSGPAAGSFAVRGIEEVQSMHRDFLLWKAYVERMSTEMSETLLRLTLSLASDEQRRVEVSRLASVSRMFLLALVGTERAKRDVARLPTIPEVLTICPDCKVLIDRFLSRCD